MINIFPIHIVLSQQVKLVLESPYSNMAAQIAATRRWIVFLVEIMFLVQIIALGRNYTIGWKLYPLVEIMPMGRNYGFV